MLSWLAGWIGISFDRAWPVAKRRQYLMRAAKLYPCRGTLPGLRSALLLFLGLDTLKIPRRAAPCAPNCTPPPPAWRAPPLILEHWKIRRWLFVGAGRLGDAAVLWGETIMGRSQLGNTAQTGVTRLDTSRAAVTDPFNVDAYAFTVFAPGGLARSAAAKASVQRLIDQQKPAWSQAKLRFVLPRMRIGIQASIGFDSVVGCWPEGVLLDAARLGTGDCLERRDRTSTPGHVSGRPGSAQLHASHERGRGFTMSMNRHADLAAGLRRLQAARAHPQQLLHRQAVGGARLHRRAMVLPREDPPASPAPARNRRRVRAADPAPNPTCPDRLVVLRPGSAVDCCGHDILVAHEEVFDITSVPAINALVQAKDTATHVLEFCLSWRECPTEEIPVLYDECGCDDTQCAPNRILESYSLDVIVRPALPPVHLHVPKLHWGSCSINIADPMAVALDEANDRLFVLAGGATSTLYQFGTQHLLSRQAFRSDAPRWIWRHPPTAPFSMLPCKGATAADPAEIWAFNPSGSGGLALPPAATLTLGSVHETSIALTAASRRAVAGRRAGERKPLALAGRNARHCDT